MKLVREHISDDNYYINLLCVASLNESLNEELNINSIKQIVNKISDKAGTATRLIKKFNETHNMHARKYLASILVVLFLANFVGKNSRWSNSGTQASVLPHTELSRVQKLTLQLVKQDNLSLKKVETIVKPDVAKDLKQPELIKSKYIAISSAKASKQAKELIKSHETLSLVAYKDQRMVSIGWGHAEYPKTSKYKIGKSTITKEKAEELFLQDVKKAEDGVKRIIKEWKNPKRELQITQGMFDAMVSMAYNMGIAGLKNTDFMTYVKTGKFKTAAEKIKTTKTRSVTTKNGIKTAIELDGLKKRRLEEYKLFASK